MDLERAFLLRSYRGGGSTALCYRDTCNLWINDEHDTCYYVKSQLGENRDHLDSRPNNYMLLNLNKRSSNVLPRSNSFIVIIINSQHITIRKIWKENPSDAAVLRSQKEEPPLCFQTIIVVAGH